MPIKDVCSPNSSGVKPRPQPLPHPDAAKFAEVAVDKIVQLSDGYHHHKIQ